MSTWHMLSVIGEDQPRIVARLTRKLQQGGCNLGEASMLRMGRSFAITLMVQYQGEAAELQQLVEPVAEQMALRLQVVPVTGHDHGHVDPDVRVTVFGADRAGIVAEVTGLLADAGLNILDLRSDVARDDGSAVYIMYIEGQAMQGVDALRAAVAQGVAQGLEVKVETLDEPLIG